TKLVLHHTVQADIGMSLTRLGEQVSKGLRSLQWVPSFCWQQLKRRAPVGPLHLIIAVADHFEPGIVLGTGERQTYAEMDEQERRLERWCSMYPTTVTPYLDADGRPFRHTYFFPAEQYNKALLQRLSEHCQAGWGEIEIHLHHGVDGPDTAANTRKTIVEF